MELGEREYKKISRMVFDLSGINLHDGKRELIRSRLAKRLRQLGLKDYKEYCEILENDPTGLEITVLIDRLSTNKTDFFREESHFEFMKLRALPELCERKKGERKKQIRIWSAGCSSGEEPYTIAVTLLENLNTSAWGDIKILATDISTTVLASAREGVYRGNIMEKVPRLQKAKYFNKTRDGAYQVSQDIKKLVTFSRLNLMEEWPMKGPFDLIFCRNVMIYFTRETQGELVRRFYELLPPNGYLFIGHSESLNNIKHNFKNVQPSVYTRPGAMDREDKCRR